MINLFETPAKKKQLRKLVRRRTPYYNKNVPFMLAWSHKSGCTSILKWHLYHAGLLDEAMKFTSERRGLDIHVYQNRNVKANRGYIKEVMHRIVKQKLPVINFVREPFSRAFSCYLHCSNPLLVRMQKKSPDAPAINVRQQILRHVYGEEVALEYPISFREYLVWLRDQNMEELNPHYTPQYSDLYHAAQIRHYRLEDFSTVTGLLEREFSLPGTENNSDIYSSGHHKKKDQLSRSVALQLLERGFSLTRTPDFQLPSVDRGLLQNTEIGDLIAEIFARDIAAYDAIPIISQDK